MTGSEQRTVEVTRLTHLGSRVRTAMYGATQCADLGFKMPQWQAGSERHFTLLSLGTKGRPWMSSMVHMLPAGFGAATVPQSTQKIRAQGVAYLPVNREGP